MEGYNLDDIITSKTQLTDYFAAAAVPRANWRTGMECEIFAVDKDSFMPVPFFGRRGIEAILKQLTQNYGWSPVFEGQNLIGLGKNGSNVTLEPGGQIELSSFPHTLIKESIEERSSFIQQLKEITLPMGIRLMSIGYHPFAAPQEVEWIPKKRYQAMSEYFLKKGGYLAHHMMKITTSVQAAIDYEDEADFACKMRLASYLTPVLQAIYANSPFKKGLFSGSFDFRSLCWEHTDNDRCGLFRKAFSKEFTFEDYTDFLLDMPMIVRFSGEEAIPMEGVPFREFLRSGTVTMEEWHSHVSFAFPEIRLRSYIELRMCDSVPEHLLPTVPALLKGLFYDSSTRKDLLDIFRNITAEEAMAAYREAHNKALQASMGGRPILEIARDIVSLADRGLAGLGSEGIISSPEEQALLDPLKEQLWEKGISPGEELVRLWEEKGRDIFRLQDVLLL